MARFQADPNRAAHLTREIQKLFGKLSWFLSEGSREHIGELKSVHLDPKRGLRLQVIDPNCRYRTFDVIWRCSMGVAKEVLESLSESRITSAPN